MAKNFKSAIQKTNFSGKSSIASLISGSTDNPINELFKGYFHLKVSSKCHISC